MNDNDTLDLNQAAAFLKMNPKSLRQKAKTGKIPGAKPGKRWCFLKSDLISYLRSHYSHGPKGVPHCVARSDSSAPTLRHDVDSEYLRLLGSISPIRQ